MQRENVTQELILAWIFSHYSTALTICPRPNGSVDMKKKRKKKQNEENAGLNVANADEKGKTKSYYKSYLFDALYFSRSQNSYGLSGGKLTCSARCSALEIKSRIKQHFSSLNRCHACIERNEFRFPVGTPSISLRWTYFRVISDARLIPNTTDSSSI